MIHVTFYIRILCISMVFISACSQKSDEETQLRQTLNELQAELEAHQVKKVMNYLEKDFLAQRLHRAPQLAQMMLIQFQQNKRVYVFLKNTEILMHYPKADVVTTAYMLGSKDIIPERGQGYDVKMRWIKVDDEWKLSRINWQRVSNE